MFVWDICQNVTAFFHSSFSIGPDLISLQLERVKSIKLLVEFNTDFFDFISLHRALHLQILNLLAHLQDVLLEVDLAVRDELAANLLDLVGLGLLLYEVQSLSELVGYRRT